MRVCRQVQSPASPCVWGRLEEERKDSRPGRRTGHGGGRQEGPGETGRGASPLPSWGHSSQGSFQPSPGLWLQQHRALVVLKALGTEHFPASKWVKQKLCRVSVGVIPRRNC